MSRHVLTVVRRRPGLLVLFLLYAVTAGLVARTPLTVAVCTVLVVTLVGQVAAVLRRSHDRDVPDVVPSP